MDDSDADNTLEYLNEQSGVLNESTVLRSGTENLSAFLFTHQQQLIELVDFNRFYRIKRQIRSI